MKKIIILLVACVVTGTAFAYDPNARVLKAFKETFSAAENIHWQEYTDYYSVSFSYSGIRSKIQYDMEGNILGSTRYYQPTLLPLHIYTKLKNSHSSKELFGVTEVTVGDDVVYFVKMQDTRNWITLKVDASGNSSVYEKYRKG